jgi:branched-subunit amino acid ABC-type transport system permease component
MSDVVQYALQGLPVGCVFALLAVGLTLNYKTSGVFNLAFAAQAYASAEVFYVLRRQHNWDLLASAFVAIVVLGTVLAWVLDRFLYRHQRTASPLAKLVTSLGLLVAIPQIVQLFLGNENRVNPPPLAPYGDSIDFLWRITGQIVLDANQIATIVATVAISVGLVVMFRRGALGLRMRAVVESPRLVKLQGINSERVALSSWVLSSLLASLAGVLIAPLFSQIDPNDFFLLLAAALAACVIGNLTSIPGAFFGGLGLGVAQAELAGYLPTGSVFATGLRPSLPFLVMFVLLIGRRSIRRQQPATDPLAGVDPPPAPPSALQRPAWMTTATRIFGVTVVVLGLLVTIYVLDSFWDTLIISGVCLSVIMLSIVLTTGIGGTISLCQGSFAAIGAFATAQLCQHNWPVMGAMVVGGFVAAAVGLVLGFPVIRLPGIYAALATLAFALMFEGLLVPLTWVSGGDGNIPLSVPRPFMFGVDFANDHAFLLLASFCLAVLGLATILVRQGTTGRFLDAVRGSAPAAAAVGINASRQRLVVFILGAGVAGFGGGLLSSYAGQANYAVNFTFEIALVWVVLVITAGSRLVQAAATSGITFFILPELLTRLFTWMHGFISFVNPDWAIGVAFILFGFGAFTYAKHPEGIIEAQTAASIPKVEAIVDRLRRRRSPPGASDEHTPPVSRGPTSDLSHASEAPA